MGLNGTGVGVTTGVAVGVIAILTNVGGTGSGVGVGFELVHARTMAVRVASNVNAADFLVVIQEADIRKELLGDGHNLPIVRNCQLA
tara:strand:- start:176 stop:436 length:261 start_codon:yes stop_codon:yes gene_type:complete